MMRFLTSLGNEIRKGLLFAWSERLQILIELPMFAVFVLLLGPLLGAGHQITAGHVHWTLSSGRTSVMVLWFVPFTFFYMQVVKLFWRLLGEIQSGTLEQVYLSPLPSWFIVAAGRVVAALIESVLVAGGTYGIVSIFVPLRYHWQASVLLPVALVIISATGFSLIIGGLTLVFKRIQLLNDTVMIVVMLASAGAVPLIAVPGWMAGAGRAFPLTAGVASLYGVLLGHRSATALWGTGGLVWLLVTAAAYLNAGILAFRGFERVAKTRGTLTRY
jgi:ABC-2 type transport system permease protein